MVCLNPFQIRALVGTADELLITLALIRLNPFQIRALVGTLIFHNVPELLDVLIPFKSGLSLEPL